jgi:hypothetical protein
MNNISSYKQIVLLPSKFYHVKYDKVKINDIPNLFSDNYDRGLIILKRQIGCSNYYSLYRLIIKQNEFLFSDIFSVKERYLYDSCNNLSELLEYALKDVTIGKNKIYLFNNTKIYLKWLLFQLNNFKIDNTIGNRIL